MLSIGKALGGGIPCGAYGLSEELAESAFTSMIAMATRFTSQVQACITRHGFRGQSGSSESAAAHDGELEDFLHLYLANRGVLMTPFTVWR